MNKPPAPDDTAPRSNRRPADAVADAKHALQQDTDAAEHDALEFIQRHPATASAAAFLAGVALGSTKTTRGPILTAFKWFARRQVTNLIKSKLAARPRKGRAAAIHADDNA
jgi:hypothetical protein